MGFVDHFCHGFVSTVYERQAWKSGKNLENCELNYDEIEPSILQLNVNIHHN
jgi:hypothetical protein